MSWVTQQDLSPYLTDCLSYFSAAPAVFTEQTLSFLSPQNFEVEADDLVTISELGRGAYGVVEKVRHAQSGTIMAVKVSRVPPAGSPPGGCWRGVELSLPMGTPQSSRPSVGSSPRRVAPGPHVRDSEVLAFHMAP